MTGPVMQLQAEKKKIVWHLHVPSVYIYMLF